MFTAYLDDDDFWLPDKISIQVNALSNLPSKTIVGCRYEIWSVLGKSIYPREIISKNQSMLNYLFGKSELRPGLRYFQTSGMILNSSDALRIGWDENMPRHNDWDFLLRSQAQGMEFFQINSTLVVVDQKHNTSISRSGNSSLSDTFYEKYKEKMTNREESLFMQTAVFQSVINSQSFVQIIQYAMHIFILDPTPKTALTILLRLLRFRRFLVKIKALH